MILEVLQVLLHNVLFMCRLREASLQKLCPCPISHSIFTAYLHNQKSPRTFIDLAEKETADSPSHFRLFTLL